MEDEFEKSTWDRMPEAAANAISAALDNNWLPASSLALYARWWQLEAWLRSLAYVELRARDGVDWTNALDANTNYRQQGDAKFEYMASPDWRDPLAYMDASILFRLLDDEWSLFSHALLDQDTWKGRRSELLGIRNRIGHLRRPHQDDLARIEQTLRDLEVGAVKAVYAYNRDRFLSMLDPADPMVTNWLHKGHSEARLIDHAARKYDMGIEFHLTTRPWSTFARGNLGTGTPGVMWSVRFVAGMRRFRTADIWRDLDGSARELVVHYLIHNISHIEFKFSAVDDPDRVSDAIGSILNAVLSSTPALYSSEEYHRESDRLKASHNVDPRVLHNHTWMVDDSMNPITLFVA